MGPGGGRELGSIGPDDSRRLAAAKRPMNGWAAIEDATWPWPPPNQLAITLPAPVPTDPYPVP